MTTIKQHISDFVSALEPPTAVWLDREGLLAIPWVKSWAEEYPGFHRYSLWQHRLMAEFDDGRQGFVVGFIKATPRELRALALPEWRAVYKTDAPAQALAPEGGA